MRHSRPVLLVAALVPGALAAVSVTLPHTFSNASVADATQVNANFDALKNALANAASTTDPRLDQWTANGNDLGRASGNVGIGRTDPAVKLDVVGDIRTSTRGGTVTGAAWTPINRVALGGVNFSAGSTATYALPPAVPANAVEVLVYAYVYLGGGNVDGDTEFRIYTAEGATEYSSYLFIHGYNQAAYSFNSDNVWLPVTSARQVKVTTSGATHAGSKGSQLYVLGYR